MIDVTRAEGTRVLVTGSQGFVGRHLRAALERRGVMVVGVDRPGTGAELELDLARATAAEVWERSGAVHSIISMAATITRTSSVDHAARTNLTVIAVAPVELIEEGVRRGLCGHIVDCSTFKVFGPQRAALIEPAEHPRRPDPFSYGSAKALGERLLSIAAPRSGFTFCTVHPTCIYGPGQHLHNAIPRFLSAALGGTSPVVFGDGASVRDDVYVVDLADILAEAALRHARGSFVAGGERARTIAEVAALCCEAAAAVGEHGRLAPRFEPSQAPKWWLDQRFSLDSSRRTFGFEPTALVEGLRCEARWLKAGSPPDTERYT